MNPHPINEIDRVVIQLPDDAMFYRDRRYLPVIIDLVDGARQPALLASSENDIHYVAQYEIFSALCRDRAQKAVDLGLLVAAAPITPERYLGIWRTAIAGAVPPETAAQQHGIHAYAVLRAPLAAMAGVKSPWTTCPFGSFDAFRAKYGDQFQFADDGTFTLQLALAAPEHASAAFYAASMMRRSFDRDCAQWSAGIELRMSARRVQTGLFETAEA